MTDPKPCPICGKPPVQPHTPFCSARCKQVDLHRWLGEVYRIEDGETPSLQNSDEDE